MDHRKIFSDRRDAGRKLAAALKSYAKESPLVLALPRGGVPVAFEVARALGAPLDLLIVRKIGAPSNPEFGIGAVVDGAEPQVVLNDVVMGMLAPKQEYVEAETKRQLAEIERRRAAYLGGREPLSPRGKTVIVVDDGIATGGTMRAALRGVKKAGAAKIVLAVPVAPRDVLASLRPETDEIVCLNARDDFEAVGFHYANFRQTEDEEVVSLLALARG
jgi:putative phosphoribosyl transferase